METGSTSTQNKLVGIIMTLVLVCALISAVALAYFQLRYDGQQATNDPTPLVLGGEKLPKNNVLVPFDYTIMSIDSSMIVISGEHGNMQLPVSDDQVTVYHVSDNSKADITDLQVGQTVNLAMVPGEKAWVGIE